MARVTLKDVAKREGVSLRTVNKWAEVGRDQGLDPRIVDQCERIKRLAGSKKVTPGAPPPKREAVAIAEEGGDLVQQLRDVRRLASTHMAAMLAAGDGAEQDRQRQAYDKALKLQIPLEAAVRQVEASKMIHVDDARSAFRAALMQIKTRLAGGRGVLLARLEAAHEEEGRAVFDGWVTEIFAEVEDDAKRRLAGI